MATMQGITGKLSGKMGSAVFRVRNGAQVVTQYNPIVKNPNSAGQQEARAKFKLLSQLGAIMKRAFGTMSVTKRAGKSAPSQRNAFMQINYPLVSVNMSADVPESASIAMEHVKLTSSVQPLGSISQDEGTTDVYLQNIPSNVSSVRFVEVEYKSYQMTDASSGSLVSVTRPEVKRIVDQPVYVDGTGNREITFASTAGCTVLAYGIIPSESVSGVDFNNVHTPQDEDFIAAVQLDTMVSNGLIQETMTLGINVAAVD